ncbi:hypothetical protein F53441_4091 [Fusarium austroafricanum]|uniref:UBC core domain-containing protein n=1 Tax=Fusarium austroafricanum TaxID=2364996 RepID=A0A8H4KP51_9HYPO|nr:hypothetical protein F53441_4091 [Fusarium austroafricanum]
MGLKEFNTDLRAAIEATLEFPRVSDLRRGDSEGELAFAYTHSPENGVEQPPIDIQALSKDVDSYPSHPGFLVFTSSETPADIEKCLQETSNSTDGKSVADVITMISRALATKLDSTDHSVSQIPSFYGEDTDDDSAFDDDDSVYDVELDEMDIEPLPLRRPTSQDATPPNYRESMARLKRHLREAKREGFQISIPPEERQSQSFGLFSLSIRVSKLGIPEEALEAWGLKPSEYIVMLFKLPSAYPSLSVFQNLSCDQTTVQFRFGKCTSPEPGPKSMRQIFLREEDSMDAETEEHDKESSADPFVPLYMSLSLDRLLNKTFPSLLRLRRSEGISWDQAQELDFKLSRGTHLQSMSNSSTDLIVKQNQDPSGDCFELDFLERDYVSGKEDDLNIALVAMQFGLQRLIKCTKYCLVCHQRAEGGFEAVKPFVCGNLLCLYQYLSLGFGQSIEHEIINNPYVVDLLISFFYTAITSSRLREFPQGLGLKCGTSAFGKSDIQPLTADACFERNVLTFQRQDLASYRSIKEGQHVLLVVSKADTIDSSLPVMRSHHEKHICHIESLDDTDFTFNVVQTSTGPMNVHPNPSERPSNEIVQPTTGGVKVLVYKYEQDIDDLQEAERGQALIFMTKCIPSVEKMRDYLAEVPGRRLSSFPRMELSTLRLLNWIVASNRSFIVQDAPVPGSSQSEGEMHKHNLVTGVSPGWMQFRFAQGSPEKEQVFLNELMKETRPQNGKNYPTLFAWHGSPLSNWHSIIRTGLDFSTTLHGRSYGDGVYMAKDFDTSCGYAIQHGLSGWPNSALNVASAISLCEIVNNPSQFVSTNPFFVVNRIDWIQCRYLFVKVQQEQSGGMPPMAPPRVSFSSRLAQNQEPFIQDPGHIEQDPAHVLTCGTGRVGIPLSAIPRFRQRAVGQVSVVGSSKDHPVVDDSDFKDGPASSHDIDDLLASDDEGATQPMSPRKRRRTSTDSGLGGTRRELDNVTPFHPGKLDLDSLPKLAEPTWASSSPGALRALNAQIKDLQKTQSSTNLATLGWYINFGKLDNLFHWIVELHSFDMDLPLSKDMIRRNCSSVVLEIRFGASFPLSPPFVRVIRPRFLPFAQGGGGHVTIGGAICSELLTNSGWSPALSLEKVFLEVRMNLCEKDPPARLEATTNLRNTQPSNINNMDYGMFEAVDAYRRAAASHGWKIPSDLEMLQSMSAQKEDQ